MNNSEIKRICEKYIGFHLPKRKLVFDEKSISSYNEAIGADKVIKVNNNQRPNMLPTFSTVCCYNILNNRKYGEERYSVFDELLDEIRECIGNTPLFLDFAHKITVDANFYDLKNALYYDDIIIDIFDRYGKGIVVRNKITIYDENNIKCAEQVGDTVFLFSGGYGGEKYPASRIHFPEREADYICMDTISNNAHLLYGQQGDVSDMHIRDDIAIQRGYKGAIVHGFCLMGYAVRNISNSLSTYRIGKIKTTSVQFKNVCYPGTDVIIEIWLDELQGYYRMKDATNGKVILDRGTFELFPD